MALHYDVNGVSTQLVVHPPASNPFSGSFLCLGNVELITTTLSSNRSVSL